ncbi:hypothetical protein ZWY2020_011402 [Hordeum vulgare]|nr:hypothetical protein ZWY2020_011402 [Hordeum vulgare]
MLWPIYYALLKSDEVLLITINSAGCVIETIYIVIYLAYAPKQAKLFTAKILLLLNVGMFGLIVACSSGKTEEISVEKVGKANNIEQA